MGCGDKKSVVVYVNRVLIMVFIMGLYLDLGMLFVGLGYVKIVLIVSVIFFMRYLLFIMKYCSMNMI